MTSFERPCSGFTATDLISLQAIWPDGTHVSDSEGDRFVVRRRGEGVPWLAIQRRREERDQRGKHRQNAPIAAHLSDFAIVSIHDARVGCCCRNAARASSLSPSS